MDEYIKQAKDFLSGVADMEIRFSHLGKYFDDDKIDRDIYDITITGKDRSRPYKFTFGQSIINSGRWQLKKKNGEIIAVSHKYNHRGEGWKRNKPQKPTEYDVLACLTKRDPGTFDDFCADFGYDNDSIKAKKTYEAVRDEYLNLCKIFTPEQMEEMEEIQ